MASRKHHEPYFKVDNRTTVSTVASKTRCSSKIWRSTRMAAIATSCARATACYELHVILRANGCGWRLIGGGGSDFSARCRAVGRGMWDGKGGGWCGWGVDYLTISTRPRSKKKGRRRGGRAVRRVAGEEAALQEEGSLARRRRSRPCGTSPWR